MKTIDDIITHSDGINRALVRVDYNIPIDADGSITESDSFRIMKSLPTLRKLLDANIQPIIMTHFGRQGDNVEPLLPFLNKLFSVVMAPSWDEYAIRSLLSSSNNKQVVLLPNTRTHPGEESNDPSFAEFLSTLGQVYINEAFSVCHRNHASVVGIASRLPSYAGQRLVAEIDHMNYIRQNARGALVIIGGLKFDTKLQVIEQYLNMGSTVAVVGALAHVFYRARGYAIGVSAYDDSVDISGIVDHDRLWIPDTVVVRNASGVTRACGADNVAPDEQIVDAGSSSVAQLVSMIAQHETVVWNGPLGLIEDQFLAGTNEVKRALSQSTAFRVAGGGDTLACIDPSEYSSVANFLSTGGGAMLEYLVQGTLPGIQALG